MREHGDAAGQPVVRGHGLYQLLLEVSTPTVVRGWRFVADLRLRPDGKGLLRALTVPAR